MDGFNPQTLRQFPNSIQSRSPIVALVSFRFTTNLHYALPESIRDLVNSLQQSVILFVCLWLLEEVGLHALDLLPVADTHSDESCWFVR